MKAPFDYANQLPWEHGHTPDRMNDVDVSNSPVSLVIPIFNSGDFLEKTIRSLLLSDLRNVQIIVSDGGSSDNTLEIINHYQELFDIVISEPDDGQSDAINKGFSHATGEIFCWLNGDDIFLPYALNHVRNYYVSNNKPDFIVGNAYMTEKDFKPINHFIFSEEKIQFDYLLDYASNHLIQPSVFFTKRAWEKCGPLDINDHFAMDADLFISISRNFKGVHLDADLAYSVYHEACKTRGKRAESISQLALVQSKHGGFQQSRKTLDLLVAMYNEIANDSKAGYSSFSDFQKVLFDLVMKAQGV